MTMRNSTRIKNVVTLLENADRKLDYVDTELAKLYEPFGEKIKNFRFNIGAAKTLIRSCRTIAQNITNADSVANQFTREELMILGQTMQEHLDALQYDTDLDDRERKEVQNALIPLYKKVQRVGKFKFMTQHEVIR